MTSAATPVANADVTLPPTDGDGLGGGGAAREETTAPCVPTTATSHYKGFSYSLPSVRPFIALNDYTQRGAATTSALRLIAAADATLAGDRPYAYTARHMVLAYRLTGRIEYLASAIASVEQVVTEAEAAIARGGRPAVAADSYLDVGSYLEDLALTFDNGFDRLTQAQRTRWSALAEQSLFNVWHPAAAVWGNTSHPWSGWSICDPGNNYHFSFLRATMLWALASQNRVWFDFLQAEKFGPLLDYYAALAGGGTREGTGYGTALNNLFGNYIYWKASTGEDLATATAHPRETIDYWLHATVPTRDRFAPIGDLSRSSLPEIYDYHENLVHAAVLLSAGTPQARRGTWWLQNNSVNGVAHAFNLPGNLLPYPDSPAAPTDLAYHASGAGVLFARSNWGTDAAWIAMIAGKYDQSHAHQDQGAFTFFKGDWLAVTNNIWSHSGIHQELEVHNTLRFERNNGTVIPQSQSSTLQSSLEFSTTGGVTTATADLVNAYSSNRHAILSWTRRLTFGGEVLRVTDTCAVEAGVRPIFQLQVPAAPTLHADGYIAAGSLRLFLHQPATYRFVAMQAPEFSRGHRIELTSTGGCGFDVELHTSGSTAPPPPGPAPTPTPDHDPASGPDTSSEIYPGPASAPVPAENCELDPIEPIWDEQAGSATRIKSPAPHMRFTAGAPIRILADARDTNAWRCPPGHPPYVCPGTEVRFYVDGTRVGTATPSATDFNLWEVRLAEGLAVGDHVLTVAYVPYDPATNGGGTPIAGLAPITIHVDPPAVHAATISLSGDVVLSGTADLDWTDKTVLGHGFRVTAAPGYSGRIIVHNARVSGLGSESALGIDVVTTGAVSIQDSVFEATGAMRFGVQGSASFTVRNNELRANNFITYVANNPWVPVVLELVGTTSGAKVVQGNRIGGGMLRINGGAAWQIGGLSAGEGNILIGVRAVLHLVNSSNARIQGNYLHHDYHGGFSQGFNLWLEGSSHNALAEHNVIRGGSWPVQNFAGEFRYNLVIDSGHNFLRSAGDNTQIHHNVFTHASGRNTGYDGAINVYGSETGLSIDNNTFDLGGATGGFNAPAVTLGSATALTSIRNNLFTAFVDVSATYGRAFLSTATGTVSSPRVAAADYNAFHNPLAPQSVRYLPGIVSVTPGVHDIQGDPRLSGPSEMPYRMPEGCIWLGRCSIGQVLAHYRAIYRPAVGSPLINAGDPADGPGTPIGAIGPNDSNPIDRFGRVVP